jgi:hypothetical protein
MNKYHIGVTRAPISTAGIAMDILFSFGGYTVGEKMKYIRGMCLLMGISKRTLARYRQKKLIRFYTISGRVWHKASEVADFLKKKWKL